MNKEILRLATEWAAEKIIKLILKKLILRFRFEVISIVLKKGLRRMEIEVLDWISRIQRIEKVLEMSILLIESYRDIKQIEDLIFHQVLETSN